MRPASYEKLPTSGLIFKNKKTMFYSTKLTLKLFLSIFVHTKSYSRKNHLDKKLYKYQKNKF